GIPDGWEVMDEFGNLRDPALDPYDPTDGALDPDEDGLCNLEEYLVRNAQVGHPPSDFGYPGAVWDYATDPFNADSDGDGMPDGWEVWFGLHPMDPVPAEYGGSITRYDALSAQGDLDGDGLWNLREYQVRYYLDSQSSTSEIYGLSTSPWNPDSDGDGLEDGEEDREFRSNPVLEDSDGDGLADGTAETGTWAEVESSPRTNMSYQYVACSTCTWEQARSKAAVYHPGYIYCQGHLATVTSSDENQRVASVVPAGATAYLGGYNPGAVSDEWYWVTGEDFVYSNFPSGSPTIVSGVTNYLAISAAGSWESVTGQVDGYVIEWDCLPSATNHFDRALNDLWMLTWPSGDDWPHWTRVEPEADSLIPPPRWGAAAVYVPVFETKNPRDDDAGGGGATILLDNRKLLVFGGQDGVYRYNDIWEFLVRSNCWRRSSSQLEAPAGLSQHAAVLFLGYKDTKPDSCECSWVPYECDGEGFLEPKSRPWADSRSFDWTFLFGGWDMEHAYRGWQSSGFFFKSDDSEAVEETCYADSESTEYVEHKTEVHPGWTVSVTSVQVDWAGHDEVESCRIFGGPYTRIYEQLHGMITTYYTNQYLGTNGFFFAGMAGAGLCEPILQAWLEFRLDSATTAAVDICVSAEFNPRSGVEMANYYKHKPGERFVSNGWYFNSSSVYYTIEAGLDQGSVFTVDVISAVSEAVGRYGFRDADGLGFIVIASNLNGSTAFIQQDSARLRVFYRPAYRVDAYWEGADYVGAEYVDRAPSQR
ncbi:MAG TPA: hypothetical protein EYP62_00410, partial [Kiritimatiellae bacterium]|nr:hypothetical protein [Kiritimatiellia bacterium]